MESERVLVTNVIDGDTIEVSGGKKVRYLGIDTPESVHPNKPVECFGPESSDRNTELVSGKQVLLVRDGPDADKYDRLLRYVFVEGQFINGLLVWEGYAYSKSYDNPTRLYQTLVQLEKGARDNKRGLWEAC